MTIIEQANNNVIDLHVWKIQQKIKMLGIFFFLYSESLVLVYHLYLCLIVHIDTN